MNVSSTSSQTQDIFDVRKIRRLAELMKEHDLSEVNLQQGELRIQLRRSAGVGQPMIAAGSMMVAPPQLAAPVPAAGKPSPADVRSNTAVIKSPMVGTFYAAPDPDAAPFVKVGDPIGPETIVCIIEAMKVFNQIPAEIVGRIIAVLAENGSPVEFGQPLFKVETGE